MKARDFERRVIVETAAAVTFAAFAGSIIGIVTVAPIVFGKLPEAAGMLFNELRRKHDEGMPAAKARKAELDALKKEKAQLEKDKKALEKKKFNARKAMAKKVYEERKAYGYEAAIPFLEDQAYLAVYETDYSEPAGKKSKKSKKK